MVVLDAYRLLRTGTRFRPPDIATCTVLFNDILDDLLEELPRARRPTRGQRGMHALLDVLANHIHLDIHKLANLLFAKRDLILCVLDKHNAECAVEVVDFGDCQRRAVDRDVSLFDDEAHKGRLADDHRRKFEDEPERVSIHIS
jgi:hypothetical protein